MVYAIHWSAETVDNKYSQVPNRTLVTVAKTQGWNSDGRSQNRTWALTQTASYGNGPSWIAIVTRMQEPRSQALQVSLVPPGLRPRPLSPPYPTLLSSPSSPAGGHITHNGGDCPGGAHGPWRHGKGTHPKKRNAWQAFRAHNPPQMQCTFLQKCKTSAVHFSEKC